MTTNWTASPGAVTPAQNDWDISNSALAEAAGVFSVSGKAGGFEDNFSTLDSKWTTNNAAIVDGALQFSGGTAYNYDQRIAYLTNFSFAELKGMTVVSKLNVKDSLARIYLGMHRPASTPLGLMYITVSTSSAGITIYSNSSQLDCLDFSSKSYPFDLYIKTEFGVDSGIKFSMSFDNETWLECGGASIENTSAKFAFLAYHSSTTYGWEVDHCNLYGYPTEITAELKDSAAISVTSPAKLADLQSFIASLSGSGGDIALYMQLSNDWCFDSEDNRYWMDFDWNINSWSLLSSSLTNGESVDIDSFISAPGTLLKIKLVYSGGGVLGYPALSQLLYTWASDILAPDAASITSLSSVDGSAFTAILGTLPAGAHHLIVEVNKNGAGFLPISTRGALESGQGYMRYTGDTSEAQKAKEINSLLVSQLAEDGDTIVIRTYAEDAVGNRSSGVDSETVTIQGAEYIPVPTDNIEIELSDHDEIIVELEALEA